MSPCSAGASTTYKRRYDRYICFTAYLILLLAEDSNMIHQQEENVFFDPFSAVLKASIGTRMEKFAPLSA